MPFNINTEFIIITYLEKVNVTNNFQDEKKIKIRNAYKAPGSKRGSKFDNN